MDAIRFGALFKASWTNGIAAIVSRPLISLIVFTLTFSTTLWSTEVAEVIRAAKVTGAAVVPKYYLREFGAAIGAVLGMVMLSVQVMRYATFGEDNSAGISYLRGVWRNWWLTWIFAFASVFGGIIAFVIPFLLMRLTSLTHGGVLMWLVIGVPLFIVVIALDAFALIRLEMLYCSRAIGERLSISGAWQLTRGRFWTIFLLHLVVGIPIYAAKILHYFFYHILLSVLSHANLLLETATVGAITTMLATAVWSACVASLYREFVAHAKVASQDIVY